MAECEVEGCENEPFRDNVCRKHHDLTARAEAGLLEERGPESNPPASPEAVGALEQGVEPVKIPFGLYLEALAYRFGRMIAKPVSAYVKATEVTMKDITYARKRKANSYFEHGRYEKAISPLNKLLELKGDDVEVLYNLGISYGKTCRYEKAVRALCKVIELDPKHVEAYYKLGVEYVRLEAYDDAIDALTKASELEPNHFEAYYKLGVVCDKKKDYDSAVTWFKKAIEADPTAFKARRSLGFTYDSMGLHDKALECLKEAVEIEEMEM